jgi:quinoprotein glucose dehydrogenase
MSSTTHRSSWAPIALGVFLVLMGLPQVIGGAWLLSLGGSWYYLPAGIALVASGVLLIRRNRLGAWVYGGLFFVTLCWSLWEAGIDGWALLPRLFGLMLLLVLVMLLVSRLEPPGRTSGFIAGGVLMLAVSVVLFGVGLARNTKVERLAAVPPPQAETAADAAIIDADDDWPVYGGTEAARRYSRLAQITPRNVAQLRLAWTYRTGDLPEERWGAETTPLEIGGKLYLCTARNVLVALDAANGQERWRFDPKVPDSAIPYTAACRGVAFFARPTDAANASAPCARRVIEGTLDARLIAVDADSGEPCADFGRNGEVDTTVGMGKVSPGMVSITSPPSVVRGVVVTGHQILDGQRRDAPSGVIQGFDAVTGELRWAWDMVHPERNGRPPPGETYARGTPNSWTASTADPELGLVYLPLGNSAADYYSSSRSEPENRYTASLVAIDVATGRLVWSFQTVHKDVWDYDLGAQGTLVDFPTASGTIPALVLPSKQGDIYVLDRRDGRPLTPVEERAVPRGGVEPEQRSPMQPFSKYHAVRYPDLEERDMWGMSPVDQMICRIQYRRASYQGIYTPPTSDRHSIEYPGYNGGTDWGGIAIDRHRGVIIANYNDMPNYVRLVPRAEADRLGWAPRDASRGELGGAEGAGDPQVGVPYAVDVNAGWRMPFTKLLCKQPPYGGIRAIDLRTGNTLWDRPLGSARANGPFGLPTFLPLEIGTPNNGGTVITATGLVFVAATTDNLIRAISIDTGETLWKDVLPAGGQATPMVYAVDGREYLVIMAGGHHFMETRRGDHVIAYSLGG